MIRIYKSLVRSVLDYACVTSMACNKNIVKNFETLQNDELRIIYKKTVIDHVKVEDMRKWADVSSIAERHEEFLTCY